MTEKKTRPKPKGQNIESTFKRLEKILDTLENQDTSLADSLAAFETGIGIVRDAQKTLAEAEQRVQILIEENGEPVEQSGEFELDDE